MSVSRARVLPYVIGMGIDVGMGVAVDDPDPDPVVCMP